jgi:NADH:ubiquinone oxidoreductase subunit 6 (subunit J)
MNNKPKWKIILIALIIILALLFVLPKFIRQPTIEERKEKLETMAETLAENYTLQTQQAGE